MLANTKISIAVPTYNRADILDFFLKTHIPILSEYNIPIYISNNASTDNTIEVVEKWSSIYPYIYISSLDENVHVDLNIENASKKSETDYTWVIGDGYEIPKTSLDYVLKILNGNHADYDLIVANLVGRITDIDERVYTDKNLALEDLGWMVACLGCTIFHKNVIHSGEYTKYRMTEFGHVGVVFDYITKPDFKLFWAPEVTVVTLKSPVRKTGWGMYYFSNIFEKWPGFIDQLPESYSVYSKKIATRKLQQRSNLLGWRYLLNIRSQGFLNKDTYSIYKDKVGDVAPTFIKYYMFILTLMPESICGLILKVVEWVRRKNYQIRKAMNPDLVM
jgi:glycosyltransferase involved in cell wall biosynthesis